MRRRHRYFRLISSVGFVLSAALATAAEPVVLSGRAMGTTWSVKWIQPMPPLEPAAIQQCIADRLEQLEQQFSNYRATSDVSRFNRNPSVEWTAVPSELARVVALARDLSAQTGGAFDVTVAPLLRLWGFGPQGGPDSPPSASAIAAARAHVAWQRVEVRSAPAALRKADPLVSVDLSSIAKGFAVDAIGELLRSAGAANHLIQIGGDLRTLGRWNHGRGWRTAIELPVEHARTLARVVILADQALSTSGDNRNFVTLAGRRFGHIIDPRTGIPASSALGSVSVIHDSCAASSALATGLFVLGPETGYAFAVREKLACLFIVREGDALVSRPTPQFTKLSDANLVPTR